MSFHIHHSNHVEQLFERLAAEVSKPLPQAGFLDGETILVDNPTLGSWLNLQLATKNSVAANISYVRPAALFWELARSLVSDAIPEQTPLNKTEITWRLLGLLGQDEVLAGDAMQPVRNYLAVDSGEDDDPYKDLKRYQLAAAVADLFDQYLIFRPQWFCESWDRLQKIADHRLKPQTDTWCEAEAWQRELWGRLLTQADLPRHLTHRAAIERRLFKALNGELDGSVLPFHRLFVFGISSMPESQLDLLMLLAKHVDIYLYLLNPCQVEWSGIRSERNIADMEVREEPGTEYLEIGNPLLASQAGQVKEFIGKLYEKADPFGEHAQVQHDACFSDPNGATLLGSIQREILNFEYRGEAAGLSTESGQKMPMPEAESLPLNAPSIHIHNCHSPLREIEVLHDQLLDMLNRDKDLRPRDIVVMMPRVAPYVPYIHAVFQGAEKECQIDYHINDRTLEEESPLLGSFKTLLKLPDSRLPLSEVLGMLELPAVQRRFGLDRESFEKLKAWLIDSGVCWGLDARNRRELGLPAYNDFSWEFGMSRLLAGYAMDAESGVVEVMPDDAIAGPFDVLPLDQVEGGDADILDGFLGFWNALEALRRQLGEAKSPEQWKNNLGTLLDTFFEPEDDEWRAMNALRHGIEELEIANDNDWYKGLLPLIVVQSMLKPVLQKEVIRRHPWSEGVKFCSLLPMRGVPFKIICLLGMNMEDYPRRLDRTSFDLMRNDYRPGDRSARVDDRWLFLEALLSARQAFHVSYVGQDMHRNEKCEPSVVLSELTDYIRHGYESGGLFKGADPVPNTHLYTQHPLQPFSPRYFNEEEREGRLISFNRQAFKVADGQGAAKRSDNSHVNAEKRWIPSSPPATGLYEVDLETFCEFFAKPWSWYFKKYGMSFNRYEEKVEDEELFELQQGLGTWIIRNELLKKTEKAGFIAPAALDERVRLKNQMIDSLIVELRAKGQWLLGPAADKEEQKLRELSVDYIFSMTGAELTQAEVDIEVPVQSSVGVQEETRVRIRGCLNMNGNEFLLRSASKAGQKHLLPFYIKLALGCMDPALRSEINQARILFNDTTDFANPGIFGPRSTRLPMLIDRAVIGDEVGTESLVKTLAGLFVTYQATGLPFHSEIEDRSLVLEGDERMEFIKSKWFGSGNNYGGQQAIRDDTGQRVYFCSPESLKSDVLFSTSSTIWSSIRRWLSTGGDQA